MIDITTEEIRPFSAAREWVTSWRRPRGKGRRRGRETSLRRVDVSTIWRWSERGVRGVKLEYVDTPSGRQTSREALARFYQCLTDVSAGGPVHRPSTVRRKSIDRAERELAEAGI